MRKLVIALVVVFSSSVAVAQPVVGISKRAPIVGSGNVGDPLRFAACPAGQTQVSTDGTGLGTYGCAVPGGVSDGDKGDITASGGGVTWSIDNSVVTLAKMANVATNVILGRVTAGSGAPEALTPAQATAMLDAFSSTLKGLVPLSGGGTTNFLRADGSWAAPPSSTGDIDGVTTAAPLSGGCTTGTCALTTSIATSRIVGRTTAGSGVMEELTGTTVTSMLDNFTSTLKGLVPLSGGGTTNYLRADGSWAAPPGAGDVTDIVTTSPMAIGTTQGATCSSGSCTVALRAANTSRFFGRITAGAGTAEELTGTQATTLLDNFTSALKGLVPLSGGGTTNYLRADGSWAAPPGTNPISGLTTNTIPKATSSTAIGNSTITDNGTNVVVNGSSGLNVSTTGVTIGGATGVGISDGSIDEVSAVLNILGNHPNGTLTFGASGFTMTTTNYGPLTVQNNVTVGSAFTNPSTFTSTSTAVNAGGATGVLALGTAGTGGINLGTSGNALAIASPTTFGQDSTLASGVRFKVKANGITPTSCGTSPTAEGDATAGTFTTGTGATTCTVPLTFTNSPYCVVQMSTAAAKTFGYTVSTSGISMTGVLGAQTFFWICTDKF